ncbi:MAG: hypothetical protein KJ060_06530 [Candidatus Hydrogenedentes bacterium]|nr:hypothetical protein [Candidatus Hydrogenedentota bacterium]
MESFLIVIPLVLVLVTLLYSVLYAILRAWLDYRVRIALLDKLDENPRLLEDGNVLGQVVPGTPSQDASPRQNYVLTGLLIVAIGVGCIVFGRLLRVGDLAVGTYLGGFLCVPIGAVIAVLGGIVKVLSRDPTAVLPPK